MVETDSGHEGSIAVAGSRRSRKRARTRETLYRAALKLFQEQGLDTTTVQQITDEADAGKGTFFHHFPTKDHVLVAYWDAFNAKLLDAWDAIRDRTAAGRLDTAMVIAGKAAQAEPELGRVLLGRVFTSPALMSSDEANEARLMAWLDRVVQAGVEAGEFSAEADLDSFKYLIVASMSSTFRDHLLGGGGNPVQQLTRRARLLIQAIESRTKEPS